MFLRCLLVPAAAGIDPTPCLEATLKLGRRLHAHMDAYLDLVDALSDDIESGPMLAKQLTFLAGADAAGIVLGAYTPIILAGRADSERTQRASCAVAVLIVPRRAESSHGAILDCAA